MKRILPFRRSSLLGVASLTLLFYHSGLAQDDDETEVFELSPFEVDASGDEGYRALSTLAGSRLNTNLADVGSSISVVTKEFLDDIGATDINTALIYSMNTEAGGPNGNVSDTIAGGESANARGTPDNTQRVRGLTRPSRTRNFFATDIPADSYNLSRVTISRGPNALLFGIGSPGGIIDSSLARASRSADFSEVQIRLGEHGANRTILKHNQTLLDGRLGVFIAALRERHEFQQRPAFEDKDRYYAAFEGLLFEGNDGALGNTILRGNFEDGEIMAERPQSSFHNNMIPWWFDARDPAKYAAYGATLPDSLRPENFVSKFMWDFENVPESGRPTHIGRALGFGGQVAASFDTDGSPAPYFPGTEGIEGLIRGSDPETGESTIVWDHFQATEWRPPSPFNIRTGRTTPYSIWDNRERLLVPGGFIASDEFNSYNLSLEQTFLQGNAGIEIAIDEQHYDTRRQQAGVNDLIGFLTVDVNLKLADGSPNPNAGRPMIRSHVSVDGRNFSKRESERATAYYILDLSDQEGFWANLGTHRFTGFIDEQTHNSRGETWFHAWDSPDAARIWGEGPAANVFNWNRQVNFNHYVGDDLRGVSNYADVRLTGGQNPFFYGPDTQPIAARLWDEENQELFDTTLSVRPYIRNGSLNRTVVDSEVLAWQGTWFDGHINTLFGIRDDESKTFNNLGLTRFPDGNINPATTYVLNDTPDLVATGETKTKSVVAHLPESWNPFSEVVGISVHWAESENFSPTSLRKDLLNRPIPPQSGVTEEEGFSLHLLDNRLMARFNWYETSLQGQTSAGVGATNDFFRVAGNGVLQRFVDARDAEIPFDELWAYASQGLSGNVPNYTSYQDIFDASINILEGPTKDILGLRLEGDSVAQNDINSQNISDTQNVTAEGFELEIIGSLNENWTLAFNAAKQQAVISDVIPLFSQIFFDARDRMVELGLFDLYTDWAPEARDMSERAIRDAFLDQLTSKVLNPLTREGRLNPEIREWRYNVISNYRFDDEGWLSGFGVGGALRWQDDIAIGYDAAYNSETDLWVPIIDNPYRGSEQFNGDAWITYQRPIFNDRVDWKAQLNIRNLIGDNDPIQVAADVDGTIYSLRNPPPREIFLTNTFSF